MGRSIHVCVGFGLWFSLQSSLGLSSVRSVCFKFVASYKAPSNLTLNRANKVWIGLWKMGHSIHVCVGFDLWFSLKSSLGLSSVRSVCFLEHTGDVVGECLGWSWLGQFWSSLKLGLTCLSLVVVGSFMLCVYKFNSDCLYLRYV